MSFAPLHNRTRVVGQVANLSYSYIDFGRRNSAAIFRVSVRFRLERSISPPMIEKPLSLAAFFLK